METDDSVDVPASFRTRPGMVGRLEEGAEVGTMDAKRRRNDDAVRCRRSAEGGLGQDGGKSESAITLEYVEGWPTCLGAS